VMQMYGPEEEKVEEKVNRGSLSGWYSEKPEDKAEGDEPKRDRSLSNWYKDGPEGESAVPSAAK
ncbi:unnamed protein product, partial [Effrenium voratum]